MRYTLVFFMFLCSWSGYSQSFFTSVYGGISNYQGDLSETLYDPRHTHFAWGVGLLYELNPNMLVRMDFTTGRISGDDADGTRNKSRNLSFTSSVSEFSLSYEYLFFSLYDYKISPYLFAGVSVFNFSPYTLGSNGNLASLYDLDTEGQGFYKGREKYALTQFSLPFGGGAQWALSDNARLGFVIGFRQTFTDYLDDVSTTYVDETLLRQRRPGPSVLYAYRGDELPDGDPYPVDGTPRGNPKNKDWYYFSGITFRLRLQGKSHRKMKYHKVRRAKVTCPAPM